MIGCLFEFHRDIVGVMFGGYVKTLRKIAELELVFTRSRAMQINSLTSASLL